LLNLEHYLDVLERKPGAMAGSTPLAQWRQQAVGRNVWMRSGGSWKHGTAEAAARGR
jgi:hypothetical protein